MVEIFNFVNRRLKVFDKKYLYRIETFCLWRYNATTVVALVHLALGYWRSNAILHLTPWAVANAGVSYRPWR